MRLYNTRYTYMQSMLRLYCLHNALYPPCKGIVAVKHKLLWQAATLHASCPHEHHKASDCHDMLLSSAKHSML
jgi:hypothetical protein